VCEGERGREAERGKERERRVAIVVIPDMTSPVQSE
jgi:hypothetical protein